MDLEQEVVAGNLRIAGNAKVAICHPAEQEGVVLGEGEEFGVTVGTADLEVGGGGDGTLILRDYG